MQVIILKYVQVLCITVFFSNNINCDKLLLHNEQEDQQLYRIGSCAAECIAEERISKSLQSCYKLCSEGAKEQGTLLVQNVALAFNIKLICRDSTSLLIEIFKVPMSDTKGTRLSQHDTRKLNSIPQHPHTKYLEAGHKGTNQNNRKRRSIAGSNTSLKNRNNEAVGGVNSMNSVNYDSILYGNDNDDKRNESAPMHIYLIKVQESGKQLGDRIVYMTNASVLKIENLSPNTQYNITATVLSSNREYIYVNKSEKFKTLPLDYTPGMVTKIDVINYRTNRQNVSLLDAIVTWKPATDKTCHYEIVYYASHTSDFQLRPIDEQQPGKLYEYTISALEMSSEYMIAVRAKNTKNPFRESELKWHPFYTPSCMDWHNYSQICAPQNVTNVRVTSVYLSADNYQFNISWDKPALLPDYYVVKLYDLDLSVSDETANSLSRNVSGDTTNVLIESFPMHGSQSEVLIIAHANNRTNLYSVVKPLFTMRVATDHWNGGRLAVIILTPILIVGLMKLFISLICRRRAKLKRYEQRCEYFKELEQKAPIDPSTNFEFKVKNIQEILQPAALSGEIIAPINDEMEISADQIKLLDVLGEGAFGLVRKGILIRPLGTYTEVAVKMLKECPSLEDIKEFRREIEVMKSVGIHPNVVCIVGHYTKNVNEMMLLTEYCSRGNLLNYLRSEWHKLLRIKENKDKTSLSKTDDSLNSSVQADKCQTPGLNGVKKPENVFNFDTSSEKPLAYKNISEHKSDPESDLSVTRIIENKLYPLIDDKRQENDSQQSENCTNACKCKVEILELPESEQDVHAKKIRCNIKIAGCECNPANDSDDREQINLVDNRCYYSDKDKEMAVSSAQLVDFAKQIAVGMDFLARNKVVHRDLAARNVLICENRTVKISDFGLSRDIYQENLYRKTGNGKLPVKWLALESLTHQIYTSQSDVWSFGILLYEICTLGGNPYPLVPTSNLISGLKNGYRMERPSTCSKELYDLMLSCWHALPIDRPTFSNIQKRLDELMQQSVENSEVVIDLDGIIDLQSTKTSLSEHSYLKPVAY